MQIELYLICITIFLIFYLLTIILNKCMDSYLQELKKEFMKNNTQEINDYQNIHIVYNLILIFILLFSNILHIWNFKTTNYIPTVNQKFISYLGIGVLFFLLGLLFSNGKKFLFDIMDNYNQIIKSTILTGISMLILPISKYCIFPITLIFTGITCLYIMDYFHVLQVKKKTMKSKEFLLQFIWFLLIDFLNSFLFIYSIWKI